MVTRSTAGRRTAAFAPTVFLALVLGAGHASATNPLEPLLVAEFDSWVENPKVDAARFRFAAPTGGQKLDMKALKAWVQAQ